MTIDPPAGEFAKGPRTKALLFHNFFRRHLKAPARVERHSGLRQYSSLLTPACTIRSLSTRSGDQRSRRQDHPSVHHAPANPAQGQRLLPCFPAYRLLGSSRHTHARTNARTPSHTTLCATQNAASISQGEITLHAPQPVTVNCNKLFLCTIQVIQPCEGVERKL
jgi:hypothetical protein